MYLIELMTGFIEYIKEFLEAHNIDIKNLITFGGFLVALIGARVWASRFRKIFKNVSDAIDSYHYSELDRLYAELLRLAIQEPHLRCPASIESDVVALSVDYDPFPDEEGHRKDLMVKQYDSYAFMVWNFLETVHDRCAISPSLRETWTPVISAENSLHRGWFLDQMRKEEKRRLAAKREGTLYIPAHKFCLGFQIFIFEHQWVNGKTGSELASWRYKTKFTNPPYYGFA